MIGNDCIVSYDTQEVDTNVLFVRTKSIFALKNVKVKLELKSKLSEPEKLKSYKATHIK